jgi:hypothetical protein
MNENAAWLPDSVRRNVPKTGGKVLQSYSLRDAVLQRVLYVPTFQHHLCINSGFIAESLGLLARELTLSFLQ